ncbi:NAD(P)/FAD-dependent oxidoreductase [Bacillus sp. DNRA2]|uniref:NAD(P)/FAD-dependent oxidoreductase n=1 Tax=Bacillus sp. DNRA2 TaxID=2723053 RepID=UPI00145F99CF|nr:NAD(P)/FAD-dependent oxidoreductase [Bacillus sp. DNRA2]NMD71623.1 NAD(P)/FAD-dependent oxidoreductase [Bacillus sp. DNRA2]
MNIAIMGAGLSGLACAITLEKNGIRPTIYEKRDKIGDRFVNGETLMSIFSGPSQDSIATLADKYGIFLNPTAHIRRIKIFSKEETAEIKTPLGFINIRGRDEKSFESHLAKQVQSSIQFNSVKTYEQLLQEHTHVVMATGDGAYVKALGNFSEDLTVSIKGATIEGSFDSNTVMAWLDYELAPFGYCFFIPFSEKEGSLSVAIPDLLENQGVEIEVLFEQLIGKLRSEWKQELKITDQFQITHYSIGICRSARIGNTFFIGNCFGTMMPFMGFGQYCSLLSGVFAAFDLCGKGNYQELMQPLRSSYENSLILRRGMEQLTNRGIDSIIRGLDGYWGEKLFQTKVFDPLKVASYLLRPYIYLKKGVSQF